MVRDTTHLLTKDEVADRLRQSPRSIERYVKDGKLKAVKVGRSIRFKLSDIADFIDGLPAAIDRE